MNRHNIEASLKTIREKLDYIERELKENGTEKVDKREKTRLDFEAAVGYVKAKARKTGRISNDDVLLLSELKGQFKGLWGKNVLANMFKGIAREDKEFRAEPYGDNTYLVPIR
jgi:hypothetical protein